MNSDDMIWIKKEAHTDNRNNIRCTDNVNNKASRYTKLNAKITAIKAKIIVSLFLGRESSTKYFIEKGAENASSNKK